MSLSPQLIILDEKNKISPWTLRFKDKVAERSYSSESLARLSNNRTIIYLASQLLFLLGLIFPSKIISDFNLQKYSIGLILYIICVNKFTKPVLVYLLPITFLLLQLLSDTLLSHNLTETISIYLAFTHLVFAIYVVVGFRFPITISIPYCLSVWLIDVIVLPAVPGKILFDTVEVTLMFSMIVLSIGAYKVEQFDRRGFLLRRELDAERQKLETERQKLDTVLSNMLPPAIAARLKENPEVIAEEHSAVTVLFADVVEFTPFSASRSPQEVVRFLNTLFSRFDALVEKAGLEKIKTIGDAYMVASGVPIYRDDHLKAMAALALELQREAEVMGVKMRIGMHTGSVVAGVIGTKKYLYDLWGATVNTAARMEAYGEAGEIHVTATVKNALQAHYSFEDRGVLDIKGMGPTHTYFLKR